MDTYNRIFSLRKISLEITYRCNIKCNFCFLYHTKRLNKKFKEMSLREIQDFIDTAGSKVEFYITGGEPFIRGDCIKIIEYIKDKKFGCGVNTNGILLTDKIIEKLAASNLNYILFSLHGPRQIQDAISGIKGSYKKIVNNIENLLTKSKKTEIIITCTINALNVPYLDKVYLLGKRLGVNRVIFEHLQFIREYELYKHQSCWRKFFSDQNNVITPLGNPLGPVNVKLLHKKIKFIKKISSKDTCFEMRPFLSLEGLDKWYNKNIAAKGCCDSILKTMVVAPDGEVRACQLYAENMGNVKTESCEKIWANKKFNIFRKVLLKAGGLFPGCVRCCQRFKIFRYN